MLNKFKFINIVEKLYLYCFDKKKNKNKKNIPINFQMLINRYNTLNTLIQNTLSANELFYYGFLLHFNEIFKRSVTSFCYTQIKT